MTINFAKTAATTLILAAAALGAASSFAAGVAKGPEGEVLLPAFTSTTTRAAVQTELIRAAKSGQIIPSIAGTTLKAPEFVSTRSAADVRAEAVAAARHPVVGTI